MLLKKRASQEILGGLYLSSFRGAGLEFHDFRKYGPQDDASLIDWKASLRSGNLLVKEYIEERNESVYFVLDISNSMLYTTTDKLKAEYAIELIATLSLCIQSVGDKVGLVMFNDDIVKYIPPSMGQSHYFSILQALQDVNSYGRSWDFCKAVKFLMNIQGSRKNQVVFLISDFIGLKGDWKHAMRSLAHKYKVNAVVIRDPVDMELPEIFESIILGDPDSHNQMLVDPAAISKSYKSATNRRLKELESELVKMDAGHMFLRIDKPFAPEVAKFFDITHYT